MLLPPQASLFLFSSNFLQRLQTHRQRNLFNFFVLMIERAPSSSHRPHSRQLELICTPVRSKLVLRARELSATLACIGAPDGNGDETRRVVTAQTRPTTFIPNPSPSPVAGFSFLPAPSSSGFSSPSKNPNPPAFQHQAKVAAAT